jgi:hypothetical protein
MLVDGVITFAKPQTQTEIKKYINSGEVFFSHLDGAEYKIVQKKSNIIRFFKKGYVHKISINDLYSKKIGLKVNSKVTPTEIAHETYELNLSESKNDLWQNYNGSSYISKKKDLYIKLCELLQIDPEKDGNYLITFDNITFKKEDLWKI